MSLEDTTSEQVEQAEMYENADESGVQLADDQLRDLAGGTDESAAVNSRCTGSGRGNHYWYDTGETRPSKYWVDDHPERKMCCKKCGATYWQRVLLA